MNLSYIDVSADKLYTWNYNDIMYKKCMPNTNSIEVQHMYAYPDVSELSAGSEDGK